MFSESFLIFSLLIFTKINNLLIRLIEVFVNVKNAQKYMFRGFCIHQKGYSRSLKQGKLAKINIFLKNAVTTFLIPLLKWNHVHCLVCENRNPFKIYLDRFILFSTKKDQVQSSFSTLILETLQVILSMPNSVMVVNNKLSFFILS